MPIFVQNRHENNQDQNCIIHIIQFILCPTTPATPPNSANQSEFLYVSAMKYNKPTLNVEQQIDLLESRDLVIPNKEEASQYILFMNHYRLSGYTIFFEEHNE